MISLCAWIQRAHVEARCKVYFKHLHRIQTMRPKHKDSYQTKGRSVPWKPDTGRHWKSALSSSAQEIVPNIAPTQVATYENVVHEEIPQADQEKEEITEQRETKSSPSEVVRPSLQSDDGTPPEASGLRVQRSEWNPIPSKKYLEFEYSMLTEEEELESFHQVVSHQCKGRWDGIFAKTKRQKQKKHV